MFRALWELAPIGLPNAVSPRWTRLNTSLNLYLLHALPCS